MNRRILLAAAVAASACLYAYSASAAGLFVAVGDSGSAYSTDGVMWRPAATFPAGRFRGVAWGGGQFVAVGPSGRIATSPDGVTWTDRSPGGEEGYESIAYRASTFVAVTGDCRRATSTDGIGWNVDWMNDTCRFGSDMLVTASSYTFVAIGGATTSQVAYTSTYGSDSWRPYSIPKCRWRAAPWNGAVFVAVGSYLDLGVVRGGSSISANGYEWSPRTVISDGDYWGAAWNGSLFAAVGENLAATSTDGTNWVQRAIPAGFYRALAWNGTLFAAVGDAGAVATSADGITWPTLQPRPTLPGGGIYWAITNGGTTPTVTALNPVSGSVGGGTRVLIAGTGFIAGATVSFGGVPATEVAVLSTTSIAVTIPAHAPGAVGVTVTNLNGLGGSSLTAYTYVANAPPPPPPPTISGLSPISSSTLGGAAVVISGTGFRDGALVNFGDAPASSVAVTSSAAMSAVAPPHDPGAVNVLVTNPDGQYGTFGGFLYSAPPTLSAVTPATGTVAGGIRVTLTGNAFQVGANVGFDGLPASDVTVVDATSITVTTPAHAAGAVDVQVLNPDGQTGTLAGAFTYTTSSAPAIARANPSNGVSAGGTRVTINGTGFASGASVDFAGVPARGVTFVDSTRVDAVAPPHDEGEVDLTVTNPDGQAGKLERGFYYLRQASSGCGADASSASLWALAALLWAQRRRPVTPRGR